METKRCAWANGDPLLERYHDEEWGTALFDDEKQFEFLTLEVMQCGLSWMTVLRKREAMDAAFDGFDPRIIARYGEEKIGELLENPGIIRSRKKIEATIHNAQSFLELQNEEGSFSKYLWDFVDGVPLRYPKDKLGGPTSELSDRISADLKKRGFKFLGSVTVYAHLQAAGLINDHEENCFKFEAAPVSPETALGKTVYIKMDRPIGTVHPKHPGLIYPVNYGYIPTLLGGDGEEQDVYLLGTDHPVSSACARIIAMVHREDDVEEKWVAAPPGTAFSRDQILEQVRFQEQYYQSSIRGFLPEEQQAYPSMR